jgi:hypothetical protein
VEGKTEDMGAFGIRGRSSEVQEFGESTDQQIFGKFEEGEEAANRTSKMGMAATKADHNREATFGPPRYINPKPFPQNTAAS